MIDWTTLLCLTGAGGLLVTLSIIDLRVRLLPDKLVFSFAVLGILFHVINQFQYLSWKEMGVGLLLGGGLLYVIRLGANRIYQQDALGLGDVKLMGAAGLWLGPDGVLAALVLGSVAGMIHGLVGAVWQGWKIGAPIRLSTLEVPAGPGFAVGIAISALCQFVIFHGGGSWWGH